MNIETYVDDLRTFIQYKFGGTNTDRTYCGHVKLFLESHRHVSQPKAITAKMIIEYLNNIPNFSTRSSAHSAIKFFYQFIQPHGESKKFKYIPYPEKVERLPVPVTKDEFISMMKVCANIKHKCIMMLAFDCGLRVSEVVGLKLTDIRSDIMQVQVRQSKGRKDRYIKLSEVLLCFLRQYAKDYKPKVYLFNGQNSLQYSIRSCQELLQTYAKKAGIKRHIKFHEQRHGYAMSLYENGTDLNKIQVMLGHNSPKTTEIYARMNNKIIQMVQSPLEQIMSESKMLSA
jgi:integrase/recombinase XerD